MNEICESEPQKKNGSGTHNTEVVQEVNKIADNYHIHNTTAKKGCQQK